MKLLFLASLFLSFSSSAAVMFQTHLDHEQAHELTWNFTSPVKNWGRTNPEQVKIKCEGDLPAYDILWSNAQTLKMVFKQNLSPGLKCKIELNVDKNKAKFSFSVPLIKVLEVRPWDFNSLEEDSAFILELEAPVDHEKFARQVYIEVDGLEEKVELDAVTGQVRIDALKEAYLKDTPNVVVLSPRRRFPLEKKIMLVVGQGFAHAYTKEGRIRRPFMITMSCQRENASAPCSPLGKISLEFTSNLSPGKISQLKLKLGKTEYSPTVDQSYYTANTTFATTLSAESTYQLIVPENFTDDEGRPLANAGKFPLNIAVGPYPPLAKFPGSFGILEANVEPVLPVTVRNVEKEVKLTKSSSVIKLTDAKRVMDLLQSINNRQWGRYTDDLRHTSIFAGQNVEVKEEKVSYSLGKSETEVLGLPLKGKGLHLVELHSPILANSLLEKQKDFFISTAVLVTNLSLHLKVGASNTLVWVTTLDNGEVVPGAEVSFFSCKGELLKKTKTNGEGFAIVSEVTKKNINCSSENPDFGYLVMAVATSNDDSTFALSKWDEGIESWRFGVNTGSSDDIDRAHTVFDRPIYKQGEKVHMLHLLRDQSEKGLILSKKSFTHVLVKNVDTDKEWKLPISWRDLGIAKSEFTVPGDAIQGTYYVSLINEKQGSREQSSAGSFQVKDFRVPLMRSTLNFQNNKTTFTQGEDPILLGHLEFLAGGVSSDTVVTMRAEVNPSYGSYFANYENFSFQFGHPQEVENDKATILEKVTVKTDKNGDFKFKVSPIPKSTRLQNINAEIEYLDPNGIYQTNSVSAQMYPYSKLIGIKGGYGNKLGKMTELKLVIIDQKEVPLKNQAFKGVLIEHITTSTRKKILGGFYSYDNQQRYEERGVVCEGKTNGQGLADCNFKAPKAGSYVIVIQTENSKSHRTFSIWGDDYWESQEYHDRFDLLGDKKEYRPGETARYEVKIPFESATVLVTKETKGVRKAFVTTYSRKDPFLSVPVEKEDFPNTFVSAFVVRGRLSEGQPSGIIDLSKPAYRMALTEMKVNRDDHMLKLDLTPNKKTYQIREKVKLKIKVATLDKSALGKTKVAISVFDEGLLLINGQHSFNVNQSLIKPTEHDVNTATAQGHVIGKRHFGLKAKPQGGGGGKDLRPRELFDTLIYWNPEVELDKNGEATLEFALNDSLTSFKIYGLAYAVDRFGTVNTSIVATQDVMTFIGTSPVIRTGDEFFATYTFKNVTSSDKELKAVLTLNGKPLAEKKITLKANASQLFKTPVKSFRTPGSATYVLSLWEGEKKIDEVKTIQKVIPLYTPRVAYTDLKEVKGSVIIPANTTNDNLSGVNVLLSSTLLPSSDSMKSFMHDYLYKCLEQDLSRVIILEDKKLWQKINREIYSYTDSRGFLRFYPTSGYGSIELTNHFMQMSYWAGLTFNAKAKVEATLSRFIEGHIKDLTTWESANYQKLRFDSMVTLKLLNSQLFQKSWLNDIAEAKPTDTLSRLMDKWILFYPGAKAQAAHDFIQMKLKIDGSTVVLSSMGNEGSGWFTTSDSSVMGRFLLLQKKLPLKSKFSDFYVANEGKFIRGYLGLRKSGHFPETVSNSYAFILQKAWKRPLVDGKTSLANRSVAWKNSEAAPLSLSREEAQKDQALKHEGKGSPWADIRYFAYPDPAKSQFQGITLSQSLAKFEGSGEYRPQDRIKLAIKIDLKSDLSMPGLRVPLPAGSTILNAESQNLDMIFQERFEHEWRGYFYYLRKGSYTLELTVRLNQPGDFEVPGSRMEALYSPEIFGELPYWQLKVLE